MGFLRITQSLLDFVCECNKIKKQLTNLKNMNMTKEQLTEYLERTRSTLNADLDTIINTTSEVVASLPRHERYYIYEALGELEFTGHQVLENIAKLKDQLCK